MTFAVPVGSHLGVEVDVGEEPGVFDDAFELDLAPVASVGARIPMSVPSDTLDP